MQPHILGHLSTNPKEPIIVDGLALMMRPDYLCDEAHEEHQTITNDQIQQQLSALRSRSLREVGPQATKLKRDYEATQAVE
jgi:hypothetical protein